MKPDDLKQNLKGAVAIMMTPFRDDLRLHEQAAADNLRWLIDSGIKSGRGLELYHAAHVKDWDRAWQIHWQLIPFISFMGRMRGDFRHLVKIAQVMIGLYGGPVLPPALPATETDRAGVEALMREAGLLE